MKTTTLADAKAHLSALIVELESGEDIVITRRGKPVARLTREPRSAPYEWSDLARWVSTPASPGMTVAEMRERNLL